MLLVSIGFHCGLDNTYGLRLHHVKEEDWIVLRRTFGILSRIVLKRTVGSHGKYCWFFFLELAVLIRATMPVQLL